MASTSTITYLLAGDIGGTNSRLRLYDTSNPEHLVENEYRNQEVFTQGERTDDAFARLIIGPFLEHCRADPKMKLKPINEGVIFCVLAVAGPVQGNQATLTNLGITIDGDFIEEHVSEITKCLIVNDFIAQGYGCVSLDLNEIDPDKIRKLTKDPDIEVDPKGVKVCVGAGTGLGECFLTHNGSGYTCYPSEGGHVEFNPRSDLEIRLRTFLMDKFGYAHRVSVERVVSGTGLVNVYEFLTLIYPDLVDDEIHNEFMTAGDNKAGVVAKNAENNEICKIAMDIMISAYGSEVGSAALKWIPTGGLYVTGGITPKNIARIEGVEGKPNLFMNAYKDKGRASVVLEKVPVFAVMVNDLGLRGAHHVCKTEFDKMPTA